MKSKWRFFKSYIRMFPVFGMLLFNVSCNSDDAGGGLPVIEEEPDAGPDVAEEDRLPLISVSTNGATIVDEPKVEAMVSIVENGSETYKGSIGIEFRGASSQRFPQKIFRCRDLGRERRGYRCVPLRVSR